MSNRFPQRPKRKLDPIIYRRRRIFFGSAALIVIILLVSIISGISNAIHNLTHPEVQASATTSAPATAAGQPCAPGAVSVIAGIGDANKTNAASFAKGINPYLWFTLTNNSTVACTFDAGSKVSFFKITSGSQTIWDSSNCDRSQDVNAVVTLQPSQPISSSPSTWLRVYSSSNGCSTGQKLAPAAGASYHLTATVGGVISNDVQFVLN
jgi:hypothetical protein